MWVAPAWRANRRLSSVSMCRYNPSPSFTVADHGGRPRAAQGSGQGGDASPEARAGAQRRDDLKAAPPRPPTIAHAAQPDAVALWGHAHAHPVVGHLEPQATPLTADHHGDPRAFAGVLDRVLDRLERAEVDRRLDLGRTAADAVVEDPDRPGRRACDGAQRFDRTAAREEHGID